MNSCQTIAVYNFKGGVGKSTTAINLAASLAHAHKMRVLVLDLDPQANATRALLGKEIEDGVPSIREILLAESHTPVSVENVALSTQVDGLRLVPANIGLAEAELKLANRAHREFLLRTALHTVARQYDFVLIDCPPSLGLLSLNALAAADSAILPCETQYLALRGIRYVWDVFALVRERLNPKLQCLGILATKYFPWSLANREVLLYIQSQRNNLPVFDTVIPKDVRAEEAPNAGKPLLLYAPDARASLAYFDLAREVISRCRA